MGNNTSRLPPYPPPPSYLDLASLLALAPNEKAWVLAALGDDPLKKAKTILENPAIGRPGLLLSSQELSIAVDDILSEFRSNIEVEESYIINLLDAIVERVRADEVGALWSMEEVISLAARMVKGEACKECYEAEYKSPIRYSENLVSQFADALEVLEDLRVLEARKNNEIDLGIDLILCGKTRFSINKLCTIHEEFESFRHLSGRPTWTRELEEMWCHKNHRCWCWDFGGRDDDHSEKCSYDINNYSQDGYEDYEDYE